MQLVQPKDFAGQFMIAQRDADLPDGPRAPMPSLYAMVLDPMPMARVVDASGTTIGLLLGVVVDYRKGALVTDQLHLDTPLSDDIDAYVEDHIYALGGSFVFVLDVPGARRVYLDACGSLSAVYDPERRCLAATSLQLLTPEENLTRFRAAMHERLQVLRDGWFAAGLTAHEGIWRLMPNHYLDLDSFETRRHWPTAPIPRAEDPTAACARILEVVRRTMETVAKTEPAHVSLTAGNETRMLVAAARPFKDDFSFVTVEAEGAEIDRDIAIQLAQQFNLPHQLVPVLEGSEADGWDWHARTGYTFGGPHMQTHPTIQALRDRRIFIGGLGGEIGRGFFWRPTDTDETDLDTEGLWARMGMPLDRDALPSVAEWMKGVEGFPALLQMDLAYLELRMGCWGFAPCYASVTPLRLHPLIARESFAAMLSLPPEWRRMQNGTNRMIQEVVKAGWPELLSVPLSRYNDYRDRLRFIRRALTKPHLITKKLRKLFG